MTGSRTSGRTASPLFSRGEPTAEALLPNYALGLPENRNHITDRDDLTEDDLEVDVNGDYDEFFDHQALQFNLTYDGDNYSIKYIGGYTDFFYDRNTDEDKSGLDRFGSSDFYVLQETQNWQHELQITWDTENLSVTTGAFIYDSTVDQRLDTLRPDRLPGPLPGRRGLLRPRRRHRPVRRRARGAREPRGLGAGTSAQAWSAPRHQSGPACRRGRCRAQPGQRRPHRSSRPGSATRAPVW
ncbi:MAG: hypothetical protein U5R48_13755 [Gammaproteobacteria bacterium]|nr:hypothetical protein [Gammaproteobacteria bacterium]